MMFTIPDSIALVAVEAAGDHVIDLAVARFDRGGPRTEFETLVDPGLLDEEAWLRASYHCGVSAELVAGAPSFADIAGTVRDLLDKTLVVGHGVGYDVGLLRWEFARLGVDFDPSRMCTYDLVRRHEPWRQEQGGFCLGAIARQLGLTNPFPLRARDHVQQLVNVVRSWPTDRALVLP